MPVRSYSSQTALGLDSRLSCRAVEGLYLSSNYLICLPGHRNGGVQATAIHYERVIQ